jgi:hypothetical protein
MHQEMPKVILYREEEFTDYLYIGISPGDIAAYHYYTRVKREQRDDREQDDRRDSTFEQRVAQKPKRREGYRRRNRKQQISQNYTMKISKISRE